MLLSEQLNGQGWGTLAMTSFRVEVSAMCRYQMLRAEEMQTEVFLVAAPGPMAAQVAATRIFGGQAARRRLLALPDRSARVMGGTEPEPV
jgi:hypothetical protein